MNGFKASRLPIVAVLGLALHWSAAFATGSHAGGHGNDEASAIGAPAMAADATRTVDVDMTDAMRFNPASVMARPGETVRFRVKNSGQLKHEFVLGTKKALKEHGEMMKQNPEMEHADENMVTLAPGKTGEVVWRFTKTGKVDFACLQPGHHDAGMKGQVVVAGHRVDAKARHAQARPA